LKKEVSVTSGYFWKSILKSHSPYPQNPKIKAKPLTFKNSRNDRDWDVVSVMDCYHVIESIILEDLKEIISLQLGKLSNEKASNNLELDPVDIQF